MVGDGRQQFASFCRAFSTRALLRSGRGGFSTPCGHISIRSQLMWIQCAKPVLPLTCRREFWLLDLVWLRAMLVEERNTRRIYVSSWPEKGNLQLWPAHGYGKYFPGTTHGYHVVVGRGGWERKNIGPSTPFPEWGRSHSTKVLYQLSGCKVYNAASCMRLGVWR